MKNKKILGIIAAAGILTLSVSVWAAENDDAKEMATTQEAESETAENAGESEGNGILIAYFTAAENSGVDAVASASYSEVDGEAVGRMRAIAEMIQDNVGGELFSIQTVENYPAGINEVIDQAAVEQDEDARPELKTEIESLDDYDTIFVGYPNWWADLPMPVYTFFDEYDFSGKTIIPFNTHNGSRLSGTVGTIEELEPDAIIVTDAFTISEHDVPDAADEVADWLESIEF